MAVWIVPVIALACGIFGAIFTRMIDDFMDYGHVLGWIRKNRAWKIVMRSQDEELMEEWRKITGSTDFHERTEMATQIYWKVATIEGRFTGIICPICMGFKITGIVGFGICLFTRAFIYPLGYWDILAILFLANPIAHYLIIKIYK